MTQVLQLATKLHDGQRRNNGEKYINHPLRVSQKFTGDEKIIALLHDTIEDCGIDAQYLINSGIDESIVNVIQILSRNINETYFHYIKRIVNSNNVSALKIKTTDLLNDMQDLKESSLKDKYRFALEMIDTKLQSIKE